MPAPPFLTSAIFPVPHGFTTRDGGVSEGPYRSLNLGFSVGDAADKVRENCRRVAEGAGVEEDAFFTVKQVHGDRVLEVGEDGPAQWEHPAGEADALWTARSGAALGIRVADCVPVLLADPGGSRVAAVHSGWRGTKSEVVGRAVEALIKDGSAADRLIAAIGPSIRVCCYRVSDDLGLQFRRQFGEEIAPRDSQGFRLDLPGAVRHTLVELGVPARHIEVLPHCTACDPGRFFSHRRDGGRTGRHIAFAVCAF